MSAADAHQQRIIGLHGRTALVLAGPGCGKTHILARRIFEAHASRGVDFADMLCLTFTNRAAREMNSRIRAQLGYSPRGLFVGNIHSFCMRFLMANRLLRPDTGILDEDDQDEYLAGVLGLHAAPARRDFRRIAAFLFQMDHAHPPHLQRRPPRPVTQADMEAVATYRDFMERNSLVAYDEIILRAYSALMSPGSRHLEMGHYSWAQVDEVQDMTPLQLAIVDRLTAGHGRTVLYLGDEQQAIFSFTGAGGVALDALKRLCGDDILRLRRNYRSPAYLVGPCNDLAASRLGIGRSLLPVAADSDGATPPSDALVAVHTAPDTHCDAICAYVRRLLAANPSQDVAILTRTNAEADLMSDTLTAHSLEHMRLSRRDLFHSVAFKTIYAHLRAIASPEASAPWVRLLYQTGALRTMAEARALSDSMAAAAFEPCALLRPDEPVAVERFVSAMTDGGREVVVFDTETTGLDTDADDIVQIAAVKMRGGKVVAGSRFEVFIAGAGRSIPPLLAGNVPNPLAEIYANAEKLDPADAFARFFDYVGDAAAVGGHNIGFDLRILRANLRRRAPQLAEPAWLAPDAPPAATFDTLSIARLLMPRLRSHTLAALIDHFGLDAVNSHNASDDVDATAALAAFMLDPARIRCAAVASLRADSRLRRASTRLAERYGAFHLAELARFRSDTDASGSLADAFDRAHSFFSSRGYTAPIERLDYLLTLIGEVAAADGATGFRPQAEAHLGELLTYNESDLFTRRIVRERLSVMTVHKAKGLEMDNVVLYDIAPGWGPESDRARVFYVALSRARRRLALFCQSRPDPVVAGIMHHFTPMPPRQLQALLAAEAPWSI